MKKRGYMPGVILLLISCFCSIVAGDQQGGMPAPGTVAFDALIGGGQAAEQMPNPGHVRQAPELTPEQRAEISLKLQRRRQEVAARCSLYYPKGPSVDEDLLSNRAFKH